MKIFISFDFDRTLADYSIAHGNSILAGIHDTYNKKFQVNWFDISCSGLTDYQIITNLVHNHGISYHDIFRNMNRCMRAIEQNFYYYLNSYPVELLDYADKAIEGLYKHDEVIIGLSTGNIKSIGLSKIKYTGIDNFFSFGSFGNEVFDRYQLLKLTKKRLTRDFDYSISDVAMHVGDSTLDILSAKKSGFVPIGVTTGSCSEQELYKAGAKFVFNNLRELNNSFDSVLEIIQQKKNIENLIPVK